MSAQQNVAQALDFTYFHRNWKYTSNILHLRHLPARTSARPHRPAPHPPAPLRRTEKARRQWRVARSGRPPPLRRAWGASACPARAIGARLPGRARNRACPPQGRRGPICRRPNRAAQPRSAHAGAPSASQNCKGACEAPTSRHRHPPRNRPCQFLPSALPSTPMTTMNISLPADLKAFVDDQVATRGYASASEYLRALIRHEQDRLRFRDLVPEGARPRTGRRDRRQASSTTCAPASAAPAAGDP